MQITYFRLKGYIKVLNGMGLDEIVIPFNTFKNRIILVQGENGCSKSTIISALSPEPDSSDSFRNEIIGDIMYNPEIIQYPAEKEIHYLDYDIYGNPITYQILIQSVVDNTRTHRTTKAFIAKNGEELNPNGNVSSFKEIRDSLLGIDPIYLDLSAIGSEHRGIVDMIPSERRKYMAEYIGSLDTYNNIFKTLSKKVSTLKSHINSLSSKLTELGNENELRLRLLQMETNLKELQSQRDDMIKSLGETEATIKLIDPEKKIHNIYTSISERLEMVNLKIAQNNNSIEQLNINSENIDTAIAKTENNITSYTNAVNDLKSNITKLLSLNEVLLKNIESDQSILTGLQHNILTPNLEETVNKLQKDYDMYASYLSDDDIAILEKVSIDDLLELQELFLDFSNKIAVLEDGCIKELFNKAVHYSISHNFKDTFHNEINEMIAVQNELELTDKEYAERYKHLTTTAESMDTALTTRPKECHIDSCPYICKYTELASNRDIKQELEDCIASIEKIKIGKDKAKNLLDQYTQMNNIVIQLNDLGSRLYHKKRTIDNFSELKQLLDSKYLITKLKSSYRFPEFKIVDSFIEKYSIYSEQQHVSMQLSQLRSELNLYNNNKNITDSLTASIASNQQTYDNNVKQIDEFIEESASKEKIITVLSTKHQELLSLNQLLKIKNELEAEKASIRTEFTEIKDKIKVLKEKIESVDELKNKLNKINLSITPLTDSINQTQHNLTNIIQYQRELSESNAQYDKMAFVRNACSPGNGLGIQSEYIKRYMNDIILDCNQMLGYMFNGSIKLDIPAINEKQFMIPFIGPNGITVPDISNGSTAQKCMIGLVFACVAMMKSSLRYNIPRFDEIDGGLDQENRITFINVLNQILDIMHCSQCIICSHNTEFDTQNTTRIICSHNGFKIEQ